MDEEQLGFDLPAENRHDGPLFDPGQIRADAHRLIAEARAVGADGLWDAAEVRYQRILFPHLVSWLPDEEERNQLCFTFMQEIERIELLLAA